MAALPWFRYVLMLCSCDLAPCGPDDSGRIVCTHPHRPKIGNLEAAIMRQFSESVNKENHRSRASSAFGQTSPVVVTIY